MIDLEKIRRAMDEDGSIPLFFVDAMTQEIERLRGALREIEQYRCRTKDSSCVIWLQSLAKKALGE